MLCRLRYQYVYGKIVVRAPRRVGMMQNPPPQKARSEAQVQTWAFSIAIPKLVQNVRWLGRL